MRKTDVDTRREHILKAASRLLQRDGYKRTTVADVAREAEVSVGSVYLEFDSKDAIVAKLALHCHEQILARMIEAATPSAPPDALQAALEARILAQHEHSGRAPHSVELLHCAACPGVKQALEHFAPRERQFVQELLEQGERQGAFELTDRADVVAGTILRLLDRLGPIHERALKGRSLEREVRRACELIVNGLRHRTKH